MVKRQPVLISEFARASGLPPDTVRFYVKRGLLKPEEGPRGGSNPYQVFTSADLAMARLVRLAQSLGFTLREIGALNEELRAAGMTKARKAAILRERLAEFEAKAAEVARLTVFLRAKIAWIEGGESGPEPELSGPVGNAETPACPSADTKGDAPSRKVGRRAAG